MKNSDRTLHSEYLELQSEYRNWEEFLLKKIEDLQTERDYVESLENLLIFMCQTYEETQKSLLKLSKEDDNDALFKVPMIQGTGNTIGIKRLSDSVFYQPKYGFIEVEKEIEKKRS